MSSRGASWLRLLLGLAALVWLFAQVDLEESWAALRRASPVWLGVAMLAQIGSKAAWLGRWRILLTVIHSRRGWGELTRLMLLGLFFNNFLPSSVGGDFARGMGLSRAGVPKAQAATSVLADRMVGTFALALTAVAAGLLGHLLLPGRGPWIPSAIVASFGVVLLWGVFHPRVLDFFLDRVQLSGEGTLRHRVRRVLEAAGVLARHGHALRSALFLSLGLCAFSTIYHWSIGRALGLEVPFVVYGVLVPAVMLLSSLPFTLNGLGIREVSFVSFLAAQGVPRPEAVAFAVLAFAGTLTFALAGGILFSLQPQVANPQSRGES